jgi:benzoate-CoA ligase
MRAMLQLSSADHGKSPPLIQIPRCYNAAHDLLERNLSAGRADKAAFIDDQASLTYGELDARSAAFANMLGSLGVEMEQRVLLCLHDTIDFPVAFLGAIKAGVVPVPVNTLLTQSDYAYVLNDSRARVAVVSAALHSLFEPLRGRAPFLRHLLVAGGDATAENSLERRLSAACFQYQVAETVCDDVCFWLYSSGSTGAPKGTVHLHSSLIQTAELYAKPILGIEETDRTFSAAKLFFAYGLGNALTFPMSVGATSILMAERPTPSAVFARFARHQPTIFGGVPTLYAALLASPELAQCQITSLRRCISAGEALPEDIGRRWRHRFDVEILDGIGSTEMLHIFLSNRPGEVRYGTTGTPVPGYSVRLVNDEGLPVGAGEQGELQVSGPTSAANYWNNRARTRSTFLGQWVRSGDKYLLREDGYFVYAGRIDDMLKVSGMYVSPAEVESTMIAHEAVLEAAVVGREDRDALIKPMAYVVLKPGVPVSEQLREALKLHVKARLAPYKYPRWIEFVDELPKTANGKIQRFKLRARAAQPMRTALLVIRDEHRSIGAVLKYLTRHVTEAATTAAISDCTLYGAMLDYIQDLPERLHHPKEDEFLFPRLRQRNAAAAPLLDELISQHATGRSKLHELRAALNAAVRSSDLQPFAEAVSTYAEFEFQHMRLEEDRLLPMAEISLSVEDWNEINAAFAANRKEQWSLSALSVAPLP